MRPVDRRRVVGLADILGLVMLSVTLAGCSGPNDLTNSPPDTHAKEVVKRAIGVDLPDEATNVYCHTIAAMQYFGYLRFDLPSTQVESFIKKHPDSPALPLFGTDRGIADRMTRMGNFSRMTKLPWWTFEGIEKPVFAERREIRKISKTRTEEFTHTVCLGEVSQGITRVLILYNEDPV
jgi:hypothetical protein